MAAQHLPDVQTAARRERAIAVAFLTVGLASWIAAGSIVTAQMIGATHLQQPDLATSVSWLLTAALLGTLCGLLGEGDGALMDVWTVGIQLGNPALDAAFAQRRPDWRAHHAVRWTASHIGAAAWVLALTYTWSLAGRAPGTTSMAQIMTLGLLLSLVLASGVVSVVGRKRARIAAAIDVASHAHRRLREPAGDAAAAASMADMADAAHDRDGEIGASGPTRLRAVHNDDDEERDASGQ